MIVKVKDLPKKAQRGEQRYSSTVTISALDGGWMINATLWPLYTRKERRIHVRRLGGPQSLSGLVEATINSLAPDGIEPQTVQTVASRHTDYAVRL